MARRTYLDTHLIVWLYAGNEELVSANAQQTLEKRDLFYSPIVRLELQFLYEIKKIKVKEEKILSFLEENLAIQACDRDFNRIVKEAVQQTWTRDPFDRIIVAQAAVDKSVLLSKDKNILHNYEFAEW